MGLLLGELGFSEGYVSAGMLVEESLIPWVRVCRKDKNTCALSLYMKAVILGGEEAALLSARLHAKAKEVRKAEQFIQIY